MTVIMNAGSGKRRATALQEVVRQGLTRRAEAKEGVVLCSAGCGLSTRLRGEDNDVNVIDLPPGRIAIERCATSGGARPFDRRDRVEFAQGVDGCAPVGGAALPQPDDATTSQRAGRLD